MKTTMTTISVSLITDMILALRPVVEEQGGGRLPDPCVGEWVTYKIKDEDGRQRKETLKTCRCGNDARFVALYDCDDAARPRGGGFVTFCAVCDAGWRWPRFEEALA